METEEALHSKTVLEKQSEKGRNDGWRVCLKNLKRMLLNSVITKARVNYDVQVSPVNNQGAVINHFTSLCHFEESFHIKMKNVLLKFWVQQDMLNNRAPSEHTFTSSA